MDGFAGKGYAPSMHAFAAAFAGSAGVKGLEVPYVDCA